MMTEPHLHKSWPQSTGSCHCEVPSQISVFLWFSGCSKNKVCSAGRGLSILTQLKIARLKHCGLRLQHWHTWRSDHPNRVRSSQIEPTCKQGRAAGNKLHSLFQTAATSARIRKPSWNVADICKSMASKEIQSEVPSEDNEEGGKCPQSCSTYAKQSLL